jgi:hypothetical protein
VEVGDLRSCLIQLLVTFAVLFAIVWFGVPFGASWLATTALNANGFTGTDTKVEVKADLPPRILLGHADSIHLTSKQVGIHDLHAASIDLTLGGVELFDRKFATVNGTLTTVTVFASDGRPVTIESVTVDGTSTAAASKLVVTKAEAVRLAESQLLASGIVAKVVLTAPDNVTITAGGRTARAKLQVNNGSLQLVPTGNDLPLLTLMAKGGGNPFAFTSVNIGPTSVTLLGTIDLQTLLGI